ncbi:MAG: acyltransferase [Zetaproteobacteria bacterium]|nr:MAG: acyltransferase [Zetaproteobacteria bacterium]
MFPEHNNFDCLRLVLALIVVLFHLAVLSGAHELGFLASYFSGNLAVDAFFVVSGFLVYMSFERSRSLGHYFEKRIRRILPAYVTVVVICSLAFFALSTLHASEYFGLDWLRYLAANLSFLNFLHSTLPGVFEQNRLQAVNGALWTIKVEVMFYLVLPALAWASEKMPRWACFTVVYVLSIIYSLVLTSLAKVHPQYLVFERQLPGQLAFFVSGMLLYVYYERFRSLAIYVIGPAFLLVVFGRHAHWLYPLYPLALGCVVVYVATVFPYLGNWGRFGDLSYGVYIWHFPLIQALVALGAFEISPWGGFLLTLLGVLMFAWLSWHFVERPFLRRSSHYRQAELAPKVQLHQYHR